MLQFVVAQQLTQKVQQVKFQLRIEFNLGGNEDQSLDFLIEGAPDYLGPVIEACQKLMGVDLQEQPELLACAELKLIEQAIAKNRWWFSISCNPKAKLSGITLFYYDNVGNKFLCNIIKT